MSVDLSVVVEKYAFLEGPRWHDGRLWLSDFFMGVVVSVDPPGEPRVEAEVRDNVPRLVSHPSLVLWNGNNENLWLREPSGWPDQPGGDRSWGERYYLETLPAVVAELDPSRPYSAGSPWSGSWAGTG